MGRGLGKLQREILWVLDHPKEQRRYDRYLTYAGHTVVTAADVIDLQPVLREVAENTGAITMRGRWPVPTCGFRVCFTRAVAGLVRRGILEKLQYVPITAVEVQPKYSCRIVQGAAGLCLNVGPTLRRFVRRVPDKC